MGEVQLVVNNCLLELQGFRKEELNYVVRLAQMIQRIEQLNEEDDFYQKTISKYIMANLKSSMVQLNFLLAIDSEDPLVLLGVVDSDMVGKKNLEDERKKGRDEEWERAHRRRRLESRTCRSLRRRGGLEAVFASADEIGEDREGAGEMEVDKQEEEEESGEEEEKKKVVNKGKDRGAMKEEEGKRDNMDSPTTPGSKPSVETYTKQLP
ncbi:PREDICTED: acidic leucine-rich nuclear phosphoprotein 32 family member A-like [Nicotiana attenuata]|uniref:acidic leucine-rich nuclear phosphoprotein 32 family member A-like n=1 Tax=Nicotiana attenuata TaxID=49451 RepID=UPI000904CD7B|nr:PREDICTED: acidic leucine-rich nuclear phosphoprotein 32 family member A-like [Nicotiana attenuata]